MTLSLRAEPLPLKADRDDVLRVGGTRVTLDTVIGAFKAGSTPEEIVLEYDTLRLEDVYLVLGYYLRHQAEVDTYLAERHRRGEARRTEADTRLPWAEVRARLLARQQGQGDAAPRNG